MSRKQRHDSRSRDEVRSAAITSIVSTIVRFVLDYLCDLI